MLSYLKINNVSIIIALVFISAFIQQTSSFRVNLRGDEDNLLKKILQDKYTDFVNKLGDNIKDSKFREAIRRLGESNEVKSEILAIKVKKLIPTQNEIDVDKSLKYPLTSVESLNYILYKEFENLFCATVSAKILKNFVTIFASIKFPIINW